MNKNVTVVLSINAYGYRDRQSNTSEAIISIDSRNFKGFAGIIACFFDFKEKYDKAIEEFNQSNADNLIIYTDLLYELSTYLHDIPKKKIEEQLSFGYKCMKLDGFNRPNRFEFICNNTDPDWFRDIVTYCSTQVFESQDGDNIITGKYTDEDDSSESTDSSDSCCSDGYCSF